MEYRDIPKTEEKVSVIGMGANYAWEDMSVIPEIIECAIKGGVNIFDTVVQNDKAFSFYKQELSHYDRKAYKLQIHFGSDYKMHNYGWTRNLDSIKESFENQIEKLACEFADIGMVHCIDTKDDFDSVMNDGLWEYMLTLQKNGLVKYLGCSTHNPAILREFIKTGKIKLAMFSINMVYDYLNLGNFAMGTLDDRYALYRECEQAGVALTVMKPYAGKRMLHADLNSFGETFSVSQCIHYALDRPAVVSVLPGVANVNELKAALNYCSATEEEKDYSKLYQLSGKNNKADGECVYCNHCQPCPAGISIGLANKYYDLSIIGDSIAQNHYMKMPIKASDCIKCGHCEKMCPFHVKQMARMEQIAKYMGC